MEEPYEKLLNRDIARVVAKPVIDVASPLLQRIVNHATWAFRRCEADAAGGKNEDLAAFILYRHAIELTDGMEAMVRESCSVPLLPLLRSSWEASLSLDYIMEDDELYVRRSLSWTHSYIRRRISKAALFDPADQRGAEFLGSYEEELGRPADFPPGAEEEHRRLQDFIESDAFDEIQAEFRRCKKERRNTEWFALFDGPGDRAKLAASLEKKIEYDWLFRQWSGIAHPGTADLYVTGGKDRQAYWNPLRNPELIAEYSFYGATFLLRCTRLMIDRFRSGEPLGSWYKENIQEPLSTLTEMARRADSSAGH